MQIVKTSETLSQALAKQTAIAFVPTMGNLHAGHIQLVELAKTKNACVVVSIFVNPLQFAANEDLSKYPRTLDVDLAKLKAAGADIVFTPSEQEIYPDFDASTNNTHQSISINLPSIANELCGAARPGHFSGMATVVLKLFNLVFFNGAQTKIAIFGKKDFQQLFIIRDMVKQFNLPIEIMAADTKREEDGLAMSSRNGYLTPAQKLEAPRLYSELSLLVDAIKQGNTDFKALEARSTECLTQLGWIVDYISVRSAQTLLPATQNDNKLVVLGAARQGTTRLIDNIEFNLTA
ncbi:pantoate--beta-alanine ligase [Candidatus Methylopumilus turicensis]|uniref:Pantothenate synthetase n=1 Tax=Candidatus Methylopumilus turicensis TaxID=1581680 RepID=A0A0B7J0V6_9PROT|nr:pantoate--beta-alanine ligase [Candidatus Methylopumilus turicensis]CEN56412.1 pantothenate synthetase [Candidatus Methylopumilus turicensis]